MFWSRAVTVKLKEVPAGVLLGALTMKCVAAVVETKMFPVWPVMLLVTVSVAVIVWLPGVCSVALKVPVPLVSVLSAGNVAAPSLLVKWTVPE